MAHSGLYVYGLIRAGQLPPLGRVGLPDGSRPGLVRAIAEGQAAAVVSPFEGVGKPAPLRRNLEPHYQVIQAVLKETTIIPMMFGHVARSEKAVRGLLADHRQAIGKELDRLEGMVEMSVKLRWDVENIFSYRLQADGVLADLRDRIFDPARPASHAEKLELGRLFEERLRAEKGRLTDRLVDALSLRAVDLDIGPTFGEKDIADVAFLMPRAWTEPFEQVVAAMAAQWPAEYMFQCSGPWAPSRFVRLDLRQTEARDQPVRQGVRCDS